MFVMAYMTMQRAHVMICMALPKQHETACIQAQRVYEK